MLKSAKGSGFTCSPTTPPLPFHKHWCFSIRTKTQIFTAWATPCSLVSTKSIGKYWTRQSPLPRLLLQYRRTAVLPRRVAGDRGTAASARKRKSRLEQKRSLGPRKEEKMRKTMSSSVQSVSTAEIHYSSARRKNLADYGEKLRTETSPFCET